MRVVPTLLGLLLCGCYTHQYVAPDELPRKLTSLDDVRVIDRHWVDHDVEAPVRARVDEGALTLRRGGVAVQRLRLGDVRAVQIRRLDLPSSIAVGAIGVALGAVAVAVSTRP